jgi:RecJ-like exonuclease
MMPAASCCSVGGGTAVGLLDTESFTHQYDFPPARVLLAALADGAEGELGAVLGVGKDRLLVWGEPPIDVREVASYVREAVPDAGVEARGGHDGEIVFLAGERDAVVDATIEALAETN